MKHVFILDENILIQSHNCKNIENDESDEDNYDSLELVITILKKCHKIGLTEELISRYREWTKNLEKKKTNFPAIRIWIQFLSNANKYVLCENHVGDLPSNLLHDRHVIEPALFLKGTLVTTDDKLKKRLDEWLEQRKLTVSIKSPRDAIEFLAESNQ